MWPQCLMKAAGSGESILIQESFQIPMDFHSSEPREYFVLPLTFQWEVEWNNSPNEELPLRDPSTARVRPQQPPTLTSLQEKAISWVTLSKDLSRGLCNGHFPQWTDWMSQALPTPWCPRSTHALFLPSTSHSGYITYWKASQVGRESLILIGISFIWVWVLRVGGRVRFWLRWGFLDQD